MDFISLWLVFKQWSLKMTSKSFVFSYHLQLSPGSHRPILHHVTRLVQREQRIMLGLQLTLSESMFSFQTKLLMHRLLLLSETYFLLKQKYPFSCFPIFRNYTLFFKEESLCIVFPTYPQDVFGRPLRFDQGRLQTHYNSVDPDPCVLPPAPQRVDSWSQFLLLESSLGSRDH